MSRDGSHDDEAPTELPSGPSAVAGAGTATFHPKFDDATDSVFDPTTRRVDRRALTALVEKARAEGRIAEEPSTSELAPEFLAQLREVRRQGVDASGKPFGDYVLFGVIGRGGMAEVRLAARARAGSEVRLAVVKVMLPQIADHPQLRQLFEEEGQACARLNHPGIVQLYDRGEVEGVPYLAFELIDGISLRELARLIDPARLPLRSVLELGAQAAEALAYAHTATREDGSPLELVHRDVTPHNVLLSREGIVKLVDFGIARFAGRDTETQHGQLRGKLGYMAPEQCRSGTRVDSRADIFALGLILAEMIGGRRVLPPQLMLITESEPAMRACLDEAKYDVPNAVAELLVQMTAVLPEERMQTAAQVASRLRDLAEVVPGDPLATVMGRDVFSRLMPLDFAAITAEPTNPSLPAAGASKVQLTTTDDIVDEEDVEDAEEAEPAYSSTVRRLRAVQRTLSAASQPPTEDGPVGPTRRVELAPSTASNDVAPTRAVGRLEELVPEPAPPSRWPWVVVAIATAATVAYVVAMSWGH
ncbi:MAG: serine/threonine-protein kinase [Deltaproteobacteria bacterium]